MDGGQGVCSPVDDRLPRVAFNKHRSLGTYSLTPSSTNLPSRAAGPLSEHTTIWGDH